MKKLCRILGITGGILTLLPYITFLGQCIYTLCLPDSEVHFESKGYASGLLIIFIGPALIAAAGFVGSLLAGKRNVLAGVLMLISGTIAVLIGFPVMIVDLLAFSLGAWLYRIGPILLLAAGVLSLVLSQRKPPEGEPPDDV